MARQKARFVTECWELARSRKIALKDAAHIVAARSEDFSTLQNAGKNGASLLANGRAWHNYRSWTRKLGKVEDSKRPDGDNWRALLPRYGKGSAEYVRPGCKKFWDLMIPLYENPNKLALRYAHKLATLAFREFYSRQGRPVPEGEIPSYGAVRYYYEHHADQKAVLIAREGEEWFRNHIAGYIERAAPRVDEIWFSDHHIFDAPVRVFDPDKGCWVAVRPWLTAWQDWGSLFFVGYRIRSISPNRDVIERAFRDGIARNNNLPPVHVYIDNGKDYRARGFTRPALSDRDKERLGTVCEILGCETHFALPYNARAKVVERMFRVVCEQFSKLWPGYRGSKPADRPAGADRYWNHPELLPTLDEFTASFERWLALVYHSNPSNGKILEGKSPLAARGASSSRLRSPVEPLALYKAFLRELPGERVVDRGGMVRALRRKYRSEALYKLTPGRDRVRVKVDPDDISVAWIYSVDGREIGPASAKPMLAPVTGEDPKNIEALREEQKRHQQQIKSAKQASAARRNLTGWRNAPALPASSTTPIIDSTPIHQQNSESLLANPAGGAIDKTLIRDLDTAIRNETTARLGTPDFDPGPDEDDAILAELEMAEVNQFSDPSDALEPPSP